MLMQPIDVVEGDWTPVNLSPKGEPQLGRRGLYAALGGDKGGGESAMAMLWVLNLADGRHSLLDIAERSGLAFPDHRARRRRSWRSTGSSARAAERAASLRRPDTGKPRAVQAEAELEGPPAQVALGETVGAAGQPMASAGSS